MQNSEIRVRAIAGMPEIHPGDDLAQILAAAMRRSEIAVADADILVVAQKIVSKSEGRIAQLDSIAPSEKASQWARAYQRDPRVIELVLREAVRVVRMERGVIIAETRHGLICANAGVDVSNTPNGTAALLPEDPDKSAANLAHALSREFQVNVGVIISDTFGRPWREGLTNVAIGVAGLAPLIDYRGQRDSENHLLQASVIAVADEIASAAELVMGKISHVPAALVQGISRGATPGTARQLLRPADRDLFR
jgi:coenzyme F420-0:L-glutamate ligase/coenzyme F420-1:gamma-L-glutamate ligase